MSNNRDSKGRFKKGNSVAVKWTEKTILPELEKILEVLTEDDSGLDNNNPVRANDIKFAEEAVMCTDVNLNSWEYWNTTEFQKKLPKESPVFALLKKIKKICELRLGYSGETMDIFMLKNHYGYLDRIDSNNKTDITTQGNAISTAIQVEIIDKREDVEVNENTND